MRRPYPHIGPGLRVKRRLKRVVEEMKKLPPSLTLEEALPRLRHVLDTPIQGLRHPPIMSDPSNAEQSSENPHALWCSFYKTYILFLDKKGKPTFSKYGKSKNYYHYSKQGIRDQKKYQIHYARVKATLIWDKVPQLKAEEILSQIKEEYKVPSEYTVYEGDVNE